MQLSREENIFEEDEENDKEKKNYEEDDENEYSNRNNLTLKIFSGNAVTECFFCEVDIDLFLEDYVKFLNRKCNSFGIEYSNGKINIMLHGEELSVTQNYDNDVTTTTYTL